MLPAMVALGIVEDEHDEAWLRIERAEQAAMLLHSCKYESDMFLSKEVLVFDALHHAEGIAQGDKKAAQALLATRISDFMIKSGDMVKSIGSQTATDLQDAQFNFKVKSALIQLAEVVRDVPLGQLRAIGDVVVAAKRFQDSFVLGHDHAAGEPQPAGDKWDLLRKRIVRKGLAAAEGGVREWLADDAVGVARTIVEQGALGGRVRHVHCGVGMLAAKLVPLIAEGNSFAAARFLCAMQLAYESCVVYSSAGKEALQEAVHSILKTLAKVLRSSEDATNSGPVSVPSEHELASKIESLLGAPGFKCNDEVAAEGLKRVVEANGCCPTHGQLKKFMLAHSADGLMTSAMIARKIRMVLELELSDRQLALSRTICSKRASVAALAEAAQDSDKLTTESMVAVSFAAPSICSCGMPFCHEEGHGESTLIVDIKLFGKSIEGFPLRTVQLAPLESYARSLLYGLRPIVGIRIQLVATALTELDTGWERQSLVQRKGLLVLYVTDPGPAKTAGIEAGEFLHSIDNEEVLTNVDFEQLVKRRTPGDLVMMRIYSERSGFRMVEVELGAMGKTVSEVRKIREEGGVPIHVIWDRQAFARAKAKHQAPVASGWKKALKTSPPPISIFAPKMSPRMGASTKSPRNGALVNGNKLTIATNIAQGFAPELTPKKNAASPLTPRNAGSGVSAAKPGTPRTSSAATRRNAGSGVSAAKPGTPRTSSAAGKATADVCSPKGELCVSSPLASPGSPSLGRTRVMSNAGTEQGMADGGATQIAAKDRTPPSVPIVRAMAQPTADMPTPPPGRSDRPNTGRSEMPAISEASSAGFGLTDEDELARSGSRQGATDTDTSMTQEASLSFATLRGVAGGGATADAGTPKPEMRVTNLPSSPRQYANRVAAPLEVTEAHATRAAAPHLESGFQVTLLQEERETAQATLAVLAPTRQPLDNAAPTAPPAQTTENRSGADHLDNLAAEVAMAIGCSGRVYDVLLKWDNDHNGSLSAHEMNAAFQSLGFNLSSADLKATVRLLDKDGNGHVDMQELYKAVKARLSDSERASGCSNRHSVASRIDLTSSIADRPKCASDTSDQEAHAKRAAALVRSDGKGHAKRAVGLPEPSQKVDPEVAAMQNAEAEAVAKQKANAEAAAKKKAEAEATAKKKAQVLEQLAEARKQAVEAAAKQKAEPPKVGQPKGGAGGRSLASERRPDPAQTAQPFNHQLAAQEIEHASAHVGNSHGLLRPGKSIGGTSSVPPNVPARTPHILTGTAAERNGSSLQRARVGKRC
jgi:hypothetical protein